LQAAEDRGFTGTTPDPTARGGIPGRSLPCGRVSWTSAAMRGRRRPAAKSGLPRRDARPGRRLQPYDRRAAPQQHHLPRWLPASPPAAPRRRPDPSAWTGLTSACGL